MYEITFVMSQEDDLLRKSINTLLAALTMVDAAYLRAHPEISSIYSGQVAYQEEGGCSDDWLDIPSTIKLGGGDCEDLACWRAAELQVRHGVRAWPTARFSRGKIGANFHTMVRHPNGRLEDPARILGLDPGFAHSCTATGKRDGSGEDRVTFVVDLFKGTDEMPLSYEVLTLLLAALTINDMRYLRAHPETPLLYDPRMGVRYTEEPNGREEWQDVRTNFQRREADCEDLACHRAAELRIKYGIAAWPTFAVKVLPTGNCLYHILVRWPDGRIEDPSRKLGMGE